MLFLTRKNKQAFWVGGARLIIIRDGRHVRVGIDAPDEANIVREEIMTDDDRERRRAELEQSQHRKRLRLADAVR